MFLPCTLWLKPFYVECKKLENYSNHSLWPESGWFEPEVAFGRSKHTQWSYVWTSSVLNTAPVSIIMLFSVVKHQYCCRPLDSKEFFRGLKIWSYAKVKVSIWGNYEGKILNSDDRQHQPAASFVRWVATSWFIVTTQSQNAGQCCRKWFPRSDSWALNTFFWLKLIQRDC